MDENRYMDVVDENGNSTKMYIIFTTEIEESQKKYVFYTNPEDKEGNVFVSSYDDEGHLGVVESDEEWEKLEEIFNTYMEENKDCDGCQKKQNCDESSCNKK